MIFLLQKLQEFNKSKQYFCKIVALNQKAQMQHPFQDKSPTKFVNAKQINFNLTNIENDDKAQIHPN